MLVKNNFYVFNLTDIIIPFSKPANKYKIGKKIRVFGLGQKNKILIKKKEFT